MENVFKKILQDTGLDTWPPFLKDMLFVSVLLAAVPVWIVLWITAIPTFSIENRSITAVMFLTIVWHPILEEILFRGVIQGGLIRKNFAQKRIIGLTAANWITSFLFVLAHLWYQPVMWATIVAVPSLAYGFFRDRYANIYPCIVLHAFYNSGFTTMNVFVQL